MPPHLGAQTRDGDNGDDSLDIASQLATVRAELAALKDRYDALHADRDRLAHLLEENMRKYKRFKRWVFVTKLDIPPKADKDRVEKGTASAPPHTQPQATIKMLETPITHRKSRSLRSTGKRTPTKFIASPRRSPLSPSRRILNTPQKRRVLSEGSPSTRRLKRARDENDSVETVEDTSQTQEDSQALTFWHPSTPSQRERTTKRSPSSCPSIPHHAPAPHSAPPTKRPRRDVPEKVPVPPPVPASRYKRVRASSPPALNAEFEIDPVGNAGVPFAFDEVVRGRRHRHGLDAGECEECRDWYEAVGPLPPRLEAPRWSESPPPPSSPTLVPSECSTTKRRGGTSPSSSTRKSTSAAVSAHRQAVSRHRAQWERAPTPPGYWEIGFPDTQAVEKINEKAAEIHRQKRAAIAREARDGGGRYRRRVP
ncbi:hypothetical protein EI94DRAFT_1668530 [Lactarius quietus]|nr:hypothetical protein EI94DRAFT_1668927 [Lactarius quietus]KAF8259834.1 hypothetical protein EI94DRAFT_1668530 [Lactarius quietus]